MTNSGKTDARVPQATGANVTIKHLAAELGLSITTISRALGGYSDVGAATRERVLEAAKRLGYRPNRNAQRLVTRKTRNIGWVQTDNDRKFVDPHFVEVMAGVLRGARAGEYDIVLTSDTDEHQLGVYDRYVKDNSVDGFILDLPQSRDPRISFLLDAQHPFVVHGREERAERYDWVDIDNFGIFYDLTRLLLANGHREIAFINGDENFVYAQQRRRGAHAALEDAGLSRDVLRIYNSAHPMGEAGFKLTRMALADRQTSAILYSSSLMAVEGHSALVRAGRGAGVDLAVATMDDQLHYLDLTPFDGQFTFARSSLREAGIRLIEKLIHRCDNLAEPRGTVIQSQIVVADGIDPTILATPRPADAA